MVVLAQCLTIKVSRKRILLAVTTTQLVISHLDFQLTFSAFIAYHVLRDDRPDQIVEIPTCEVTCSSKSLLLVNQNLSHRISY